MRLRSGVFASSCLLVEALGVALFLRGFFPVPVRSLPRREARGDPPAEPAPPGPGNQQPPYLSAKRYYWLAVSQHFTERCDPKPEMALLTRTNGKPVEGE